MPRIIDAEHLKKRATDCLGDCWDNYAQSTEDFLEYIDNEPTVDAVPIEWIPCSERLPNDDEILYDGIEQEGRRYVSDRILAIDKDGFMRTGYFMNAMDAPRFGKRYEFGEHYRNDPTNWICGESCKIYDPIAWMPLPKPYREKEREDAKTD